jgi:hypothetical protein
MHDACGVGVAAMLFLEHAMVSCSCMSTLPSGCFSVTYQKRTRGELTSFSTASQLLILNEVDFIPDRMSTIA